MARSRELKVVISGDPSSLSRAFAKAETQATKFGSTVDKASGRAGRSLSLFAKTGIGAAGLGFGAMLRAGVDYEKQMARVRGVTNATGEQMKTLGDLAKELGARTKFSAGEAATAMYELGSAGFQVRDMSKVLPGTLSLAAASNIELSDAAEIAANALNGFGLAGSEMDHVADVLAQTTNRTSVEMRDLQLSMKYIGPVAKTTGQDFETMLAAVGEMGNVGIKGEQAGTTLRAALVRLTRPTKSVLEGFDQLGIKAGELNGPKGLKPLPEIIGILEDKTKGMDRATRNAALANIFGTEALSGMVALVDQGSAALKKNADANRNSEGAAKKAADTMNNTVAGAWENFTGSIETASISLYETFAPALKDALKGAAGFVNDLADLPGKIKHEFDALSATRGGPGAAIGAMLQNGFDDVDWKAIGQKISAGLRGAFKLSGDISGQVATGLQTAFSDIDGRKVLGGLLDTIGEALNALFSPSFWIEHFSAIFSIVTFVIPVGKILKIPGFSTLFRFISGPIFRAVGAVGSGLVSLLGRAGSRAFTSFLAEIEKSFPRIANAMLRIATGGAGALRSFPGLVKQWAGRAVGALVDRLGDAVGRVAGVMGRAVGAGVARLGRGVADFAGAAARLVRAILGKLDDLAGNVPSKIAKALAAGTARMAGWVTNFASAAVKLGTGLVDGIVRGVKSTIGKVAGAITGGIGGFVGKITGKGEGIGKQAGSQIGAGSSLGGLPVPKGGSGGLMGANPALGGFARIGGRFGLHVSSGLRPGSRTALGPSYHSTGEALDLSNGYATPQELGFFKFMKSTYGSRLAELIHTPGGVGIKDGKPFMYTGKVAADHFDHVHVALDLGGPGPGIGDGQGRSLSGVNLAIDAARKAGFTGTDLVNMVAIAGRESSYNPNAQNLVPPDHSIGLWQINQLAHHGRYGSDAQLKNAYVNARAARALFKAAGLTPWAHAGGPLGGTNVAAARKAVLAFRGGGGSASPGPRAGSQGPGSAGGSSGGGVTVQPERVSQYEMATALSDAQIARAEGTKGTADDLRAKEVRRSIVSARIKKVKAALRKRNLTPATRLRLTQELAQLRGEHNTLQSDIQGLRHPQTDPAVDTATDSAGGQDNQALIDAINANTEAQQKAADAYAAHQQELAGVQSELKRQTDLATAVQTTESFQLKKYLADVLSGQIGGFGVAPRAYTPGTGVAAAY